MILLGSGPGSSSFWLGFLRQVQSAGMLTGKSDLLSVQLEQLNFFLHVSHYLQEAYPRYVLMAGSGIQRDAQELVQFLLVSVFPIGLNKPRIRVRKHDKIWIEAGMEA